MKGIIFTVMNTTNGKLYVSSSSMTIDEIEEHQLELLENNEHPNTSLQDDFNEGTPNDFLVAQLTPQLDQEVLKQTEAEFTKKKDNKDRIYNEKE